MTAAADPAPLAGRLPAPPPWQRNAVFGFLGSTLVMGWIGSALFSVLVDTHPLWLVSLNPSAKYLVLAVNRLDWWAYYPVAFIRLMITKPFMWLIGAWYGERAVAFAARRSERSAAVIRWLQGAFGRFGSVVVVIMASNAVCLLAGSSGMSLRRFVTLAGLGTAVRLVLYRRFGALFAEPIDDVIDFVTAHRLPVAIVSVLVVAVGILWQRHTGQGGLQDLAQLERDTD